MNDSLEIMEKQFPNLDGFQATTLGESLQYRVVRNNNIQILNVSRMHWVATSSDEEGNIYLYDSLFSGSLDSTLENQLASIYRTHDSSFNVHVLPVQQQQNGSDCGVFAVAFLVEVATGGDVNTVIFRPEAMRGHLAKCIKENKFSPFPKRQRRTKIARAEACTITIKVYCVCRLPETFSATMFDCDSCHEWFHNDCFGHQKAPSHFICSECSARRGRKRKAREISKKH